MFSTTGVVIRVFAPLTEYVAPGFFHRDAVYSADPAVVFAATRQREESMGDVCTEVATLAPEEVRLCATMTLSVPEGAGMVRFVPTHICDKINLAGRADLRDPAVLAQCGDHALELLAAHKPTIVGPYRLKSADRSDPETELALYKAIDLQDGVLIRGLYTLIKGQGLMGSDLFIFMEEAFMNLQISREAALQLVRDHLRYLGNANPSYADAHDHVRKHFDYGDHLARFLEEQHELWVETKHPCSSVGAEWAPSISADDFYDAYGCLISLYRHILLGEEGRSSAHI